MSKLPVECFCGEDSIVVLVEQDVITKQFMVRGLRDAIKAKLDYIGDPTKIKIHKRGTKEVAKDPLTSSIVAAGENYGSCDYEVTPSSKASAELQLFMVTATIRGAGLRLGIRSYLYAAAERCFALSVNPQHAITYDGETHDLLVKLLFKSEEQAFSMQNAVTELTSPPVSFPRENIDSPDPTAARMDDKGVIRVHKSHYNPKDSTSPQQTLECLRETTEASPSLVSLTDDLFLHQSIENPEMWHLQRPEKCHIIPAAKRGKSESANLLSLFRYMHHLYDGIETQVPGVPEIMIVPSDRPEDKEEQLTTSPPRVKVPLLIKLRHDNVMNGVIAYLKNGTQRLDERTLLTSVAVLSNDVVQFKKNLKTKAACTAKDWEDARRL